jgi:hypothetical protein
MKEFVEKFPFVKKVILDGTERPVQRPKDNEKQEEHQERRNGILASTLQAVQMKSVLST